MRETISEDELRRMVRDALREALPNLGGAAGAKGGRADRADRADRAETANPEAELERRIAAAARDGGTVAVDLADTEAATRFARTLLSCARRRDVASAIEGGRLRFAPKGTGAGAGAERSARAETRVEHGLISETRIAELAKSTDRLVLGPRAVLTPLARDRARHLKIEIVRRKP